MLLRNTQFGHGIKELEDRTANNENPANHEDRKGEELTNVIGRRTKRAYMQNWESPTLTATMATHNRRRGADSCVRVDWRRAVNGEYDCKRRNQ